MVGLRCIRCSRAGAANDGSCTCLQQPVRRLRAGWCRNMTDAGAIFGTCICVSWPPPCGMHYRRRRRTTTCPSPTGTTNFVHRYPFSCVSIGLTIGKRPVVGVVFNPILGEEHAHSHSLAIPGIRLDLGHRRQWTSRSSKAVCAGRCFPVGGQPCSQAPCCRFSPPRAPPQQRCAPRCRRSPTRRRAVPRHPRRRRLPQQPAHPSV